MKTNTWHTNAIFILTIIFTTLTPLFFIPVLSEFYHLPKTVFITAIASLMVIIKILYTLTEKHFSIELKPGQIPVLILLVSYWISTFFQSPNFTEAIYERTLLITSLSVIFIIVSNTLAATQIPQILNSLIFSSTILAIITIMQVIGINGQLFGATWLSSKQWSPAGTPLAVITLLIVAAILAGIRGFKHHQMIQKAVLFTAVVLQGIALVVLIMELIPTADNPKILNLPYSMGYSIAVDTLKNWRTALFGVGPGNFLAAFTFFKPLTYNRSDILWNIRFGTSSNELYHTMTITGIVGLAGLLLTMLYMGKNAISSAKSNLDFSLATGVILLSILLVPFNASLLALFFIFLTAHAILSTSYKIIDVNTPATRFGSVLALLVISVGSLFYAGKFIVADAYYYNSIQAVARNQGKIAYENQVQALKINNTKPSYNVTFSQTNLLLANALARKESLTDEEKKTILTLIQQSINSARRAVALNPQNVNSWENLANIYRQLINFANRADQFAIQSYGIALRLDPRNPRLWVDYGGLLVSMKDYENGSIAFRQAISLKNNYANAHYNLANVYKLQNKQNLAYQELQRVLGLIDPQGDTFQKVQKETEELAKQLGTQANQATPSGSTKPAAGDQQTIQTPSPAPQRPDQIQPIELPERESPNAINPSDSSKLPIPSGNPTPSVENNEQGATPTPSTPTNTTPTPTL